VACLRNWSFSPDTVSFHLVKLLEQRQLALFVMVMRFIGLIECLLLLYGCWLSVVSNRKPSSSLKTTKASAIPLIPRMLKVFTLFVVRNTVQFPSSTTHYYQFCPLPASSTTQRCSGGVQPCLQPEILLERTPENFAFDMAKHQNQRSLFKQVFVSFHPLDTCIRSQRLPDALSIP
jgi:hypothetical protein